ncbi:MAG: TldD/PmbA family protein [Methanomethylovorans sp.]|jgi:PmbA protein|nr:TldD/PmbA family protein [Methanomethylovorans sp.]
MYDIARKALNAALKAGADEAEVYLLKSEITGIDIRKGIIDGSKESINQGMGIRAVVNGAVGFASTNIPSKIEEAAKTAVSSARVRGADPAWKSFPTDGKYPEIEDTFDPRINDMGLDECIELAANMLHGASSLPDVLVTSGSFSRMISRRLILNSNGIEVEDRGTAITGFVDVITGKDEPTTAYEYDMSRKMDIDFFNLGKAAAELVFKSKNGISIEPHHTEVILHPFAVSDLLTGILSSAIDADNVQKGRSRLIGCKGEMIADEKLSIIDDGLLKGGLETSMADEEGVPSQTTPVIENGIFKSYLYDTYTAGKEGVHSTGNASRHSYSSPPSVGIRNFIIEYEQSNVIESTDKGIYINSVIGAHTANYISGDFSVEARNAFIIEKGELSKPIKSLMISGNVFDILRNINGAGKDVRQIGATVTSSLRIADMSVIG